MERCSFKNACLGLFVFGLIGSQTQASFMGTVDARETDVFGTVVNIHGLFNVDGMSGIYHLDKTGGTDLGATIPNGSTNAFCTELAQYAPTSQVVFDVYTPAEAPKPGAGMGSTREALLRELWGRYYSEINGNTKRASTFQVCVWELGHETAGTYNVSSGNIWFGGNYDATLANTWLSSLDGTGPMANLVALTNPSYQDYLVEVAVPEPSILMLMSVGLLLARRRRHAA